MLSTCCPRLSLPLDRVTTPRPRVPPARAGYDPVLFLFSFRVSFVPCPPFRLFGLYKSEFIVFLYSRFVYLV